MHSRLVARASSFGDDPGSKGCMEGNDGMLSINGKHRRGRIGDVQLIAEIGRDAVPDKAIFSNSCTYFVYTAYRTGVMTKTLLKTGNSHSLVISKEMKAHLKIEDNRIEVEFHDGRIVLSKPATFEEAMEETLAQFGTALKNLGK